MPRSIYSLKLQQAASSLIDLRSISPDLIRAVSMVSVTESKGTVDGKLTTPNSASPTSHSPSDQFHPS